MLGISWVVTNEHACLGLEPTMYLVRDSGSVYFLSVSVQYTLRLSTRSVRFLAGDTGDPRGPRGPQGIPEDPKGPQKKF